MKKYIYAMSFPKAEALRRAEFYSENILEHLIKILVYGNIRSEDVDHWKGEISTWLRSVDSLTVKPFNKRLKPNDIRDTTFACMGDHLEDYLSSLEMFQYDNKKGKFNYENKEPYPEVKPDFQTASDLMDICCKLIERLIPMLCSKEDHSRQDFNRVIDSVVDRYIL